MTLITVARYTTLQSESSFESLVGSAARLQADELALDLGHLDDALTGLRDVSRGLQWEPIGAEIVEAQLAEPEIAIKTIVAALDALQQSEEAAHDAVRQQTEREDSAIGMNLERASDQYEQLQGAIDTLGGRQAPGQPAAESSAGPAEPQLELVAFMIAPDHVWPF